MVKEYYLRIVQDKSSRKAEEISALEFGKLTTSPLKIAYERNITSRAHLFVYISVIWQCVGMLIITANKQNSKHDMGD